MKIYVVTSGFYSDYHIEKVFTDKKAAEAYCRERNICCFEEDEYSAGIEEYQADNVEEQGIITLKIIGEFNCKGELIDKTMLETTQNICNAQPSIEENDHGDLVTAYAIPRQGEGVEDFRERAKKILIDTYYSLIDKRFEERKKQWKS